MSNGLHAGSDRTMAHAAAQDTVPDKLGSGTGVLATCVPASSLAFIDGSVVNVALPAIGHSLQAEGAGLSWLVNVYLLPLGALLLLLGGAAGDVHVETSTVGRQAEVSAAQTMLTRTADRFGLRPERLVADTGYGSAAMLVWLVHEQDIEPHIPVFDKSTRNDGTFTRRPFSVMITTSFAAAIRACMKSAVPRGRPRGLPLCLGLNREWAGGLPRPTA